MSQCQEHWLMSFGEGQMRSRSKIDFKIQWEKWKRGQGAQKAMVGILFMIVPLALLFTFTYVPFFQFFQFSFYRMKYLGPRTYIGLQNYIDVFSRPELFNSLKLSLYYLLGAIVQLCLALFFATILSSKVKGGSIFKGMIFFPYLVSGIAIGYIFKFFFTHGIVLDSMLMVFGFDLEDLPFWLNNTKINNFSLVSTSIWKYMGQNMVLFIGAIMSVDPNLYEVAEIDGANQWHKFIYIILPSIKTIVLLNLILSITGSIAAFEPSYVITKGTFGTATYFVMMDRLAHGNNQKVGLASAMAVVLFVIIIIVTLFQKLIFYYAFDDGQDDSGVPRKEVKAAKKRDRINRKKGLLQSQMTTQQNNRAVNPEISGEEKQKR